jgi:hypothetical protein
LVCLKGGNTWMAGVNWMLVGASGHRPSSRLVNI